MAQKSFHRTDRVSAQLRRELGTLVHEAVREHGLASASVSDVELTRDMAHAKVFVTVLIQERAAETMKALKALAPEIRRWTGGNPFLVVQLGRLVAADPDALTRGTIPTGSM